MTEVQKVLNNIKLINNWSDFKSKYINISNDIIQMLGRNIDSDFKINLNNQSFRITGDSYELKAFINKFNMVGGKNFIWMRKHKLIILILIIFQAYQIDKCQ